MTLPERPIAIGSPEWHMNMSRLMATVQTLIREHGWAIQGVFATEESSAANFAHTIGLWERNLPELIVTGLTMQESQEVLNDLAKVTCELGGTPDTWPLESGFELRMLTHRSCDTQGLKLGSAHQYYRGHVPVTQVLWPDEQRRYPDQETWPHGAEVQPLCKPIEGTDDEHGHPHRG